MRIAVTRSGGFAGLVRRGEGDTEASPELAEMADRADLAGLPARLSDVGAGARTDDARTDDTGAARGGPPSHPDAFSYAISLDGGDALTVPEHLLEGPLRELVETVLATAPPQSAAPGTGST